MALPETRVSLSPAKALHSSHLSGRWLPTPHHSLRSSWSGSALHFQAHASHIALRMGEHTSRKDSWNGGVRMMAWRVAPVDGEEGEWTSTDAEPGSEVVLLVDRNGAWDVEVVLVDWASEIELDAIVLNPEGKLLDSVDLAQPTRLLFIGDSFTCGYCYPASASPTSTSAQPPLLPLGSLDAFPFVTLRLLKERFPKKDIVVETVAYPGLTLVSPNEEERDEGMAEGMARKFFHASPWSDETGYIDHAPSGIILALGTNDETMNTSPNRFHAALVAFCTQLLEQYEASLRLLYIIFPFRDFTSDSGSSDSDDEPTTSLASAVSSAVSDIRAETERSGSKVVVEAVDISAGMEEKYTIDGLHPSKDGHGLMGRSLCERLSRLWTES